MDDWNEIRAWRKATRERLLAERQALPPEQREALGTRVRDHVLHWLEGRWPRTLGIYWPIRSEINLVPVAEAVLAHGGRVGLPVVVRKAAPLEFWNWHRGIRLVRGDWDIPVPKERDPVVPDLCIVPLVGFAGRYRLGYGGGYFDRTLAALTPRPATVGVAFGFARLATIHPQAHDIPMDHIITEEGLQA